MDWHTVLIIYAVILIPTLALGAPIGSALGFVGIVGVTLVFGINLWPSIGDVIWNASDSYILAAVPLFVLMGEIIVRCGVSGRFYEGLSVLLGRVPGGLAHSNIAGSALFAAISGSSTATALTIGTVAIPEMRKRNYDDRLTLGTLVGGGCLGILIPPSIPLLIYAVIVQKSVVALFMAGLIPGILLAVLFMLYVGYRVWRSPDLAPLPGSDINKNHNLRHKSLFDTLPIIILMLSILGGMYGGIVTPTEAAGVGCLIALCISLVYGGVTFSSLREALRNSVVISAVVMFVIINAQIFSYALTMSGVGKGVSDMLLSMGVGPFAFFCALVIVYLILGMLIDGISMMLLTIPLLYPAVLAYGFDGVWFGIVLVVLMELGQITPPMGLNLFAVQSISGGVSIGNIARSAIPFAICILLLCFLLYFFPDLALWLPRQL